MESRSNGHALFALWLCIICLGCSDDKPQDNPTPETEKSRHYAGFEYFRTGDLFQLEHGVVIQLYGENRQLLKAMGKYNGSTQKNNVLIAAYFPATANPLQVAFAISEFIEGGSSWVNLRSLIDQGMFTMGIISVKLGEPSDPDGQLMDTQVREQKQRLVDEVEKHLAGTPGKQSWLPKTYGEKLHVVK